jgi:hypothetical protein
VTLAVVLGICIVAGTVLLARRWRPSQPAPAGSAALNPSARFVKVVFRVDPANADIHVDGERKGSAGHVIELPRSDASTDVVISKAGYVSRTVAVVFDRDQYVKDIVLVPVAGTGASPSAVP